jgi:hypothetical protein|tara:strand:- start:360 stop:545 length:186 start_codon:yes stop_codon:yes gene_type:complete
MIKQRTFTVNDEKFVIKSKPQTYMRNLSGWYVFINNKKHFVNTLERESAEDIAFKRYLESK